MSQWVRMRGNDYHPGLSSDLYTVTVMNTHRPELTGSLAHMKVLKSSMFLGLKSQSKHFTLKLFLSLLRMQ